MTFPIVLTLCITAVVLVFIWAAVIMSAAEKVTQQKGCTCDRKSSGRGIKVNGSGTAADPYDVNPLGRKEN